MARALLPEIACGLTLTSFCSNGSAKRRSCSLVSSLRMVVTLVSPQVGLELEGDVLEQRQPGRGPLRVVVDAFFPSRVHPRRRGRHVAEDGADGPVLPGRAVAASLAVGAAPVPGHGTRVAEVLLAADGAGRRQRPAG